MRRWTGWYTHFMAKDGLWLRPYGRKWGRWTKFRLYLAHEDAVIERHREWHRQSPAPCGHSCHKHRPCDVCWYPRPGWTIRTVRNAGRTR